MGGGSPQLFDQIRILRDVASAGALGAHQALTFQLGQSPLHRVGVDPGSCGQIPHRIQMAPRRVGARQNSGFEPFHQLGIDRAAGIKLFTHSALPSLCVAVLSS